MFRVQVYYDDVEKMRKYVKSLSRKRILRTYKHERYERYEFNEFVVTATKGFREGERGQKFDIAVVDDAIIIMGDDQKWNDMRMKILACKTSEISILYY